jgi:CheY-like chemotaxis protein
MTTILFADNDPDFLDTRREYLEKEGYRVIPALNLSEAKRVIGQGNIDLAILDIRLEDDDDEKDISGLILAKDDAPSLPKILLTAFPSYDYVRSVLKPQLEGLPAAIDFIAKQEGPEVMLRAVQRALEFGSAWLRKTTDNITDQLTADYLDARRQARTNYSWAIAIAVVGIVIIFFGTILALSWRLDVGVASTVCGLLTEGINFLFFKRVDIANKRMDRYHAEALQTRRFENLLAACDEIKPKEKREESKMMVIEAARTYWFGGQNHKG